MIARKRNTEMRLLRARRRQIQPPPMPKGNGLLIGVRMEAQVVDSIDAWISASTEPRMTRPEAVRRLLAEALGVPLITDAAAATPLPKRNGKALPEAAATSIDMA